MKSTLSINRQQLAVFAASFLNGAGYPNPDDSDPVGPWGPVIHKALRNTNIQAGPGFSLIGVIAKKYPQIWDILDGPVSKVALNPQPLPPRIVFAASLAQEVIERAWLIQDITAIMQPRETPAFVGSYISSFTDAICPDPPKIKFPKKGPWPPDPEPDPRWSAAELMVIGMSLKDAAISFADADVQKAFDQAGATIMETAVERM